jgi:hypothetical protein
MRGGPLTNEIIDFFSNEKSAISESARKDIETTLRDVGIDPKMCEADIRTAVA